MMSGNRYVVTIGISVLTLLLIYLIAKELYDDVNLALLAFFFGSVSPFFYFVSSSRLSHTTTAFLLALFLYLFLRLRQEGRWEKRSALALFSGIVLGYAFNVRPLTAIGFGAPFFFLWLTNHPQFPRKRMQIGVLMGAGFLVILGLTLWYNYVVTGNCLVFPFHYYSAWQRVGFNADHTPFSALHNFAMSFSRLNWALYGFPLSLIFVIAAAFDRKGFADRLLFGILGSFALAYLLYFSPGVQDLGPVYYYEAFVPLAILSARGVFFLRDVASRYYGQARVFISHFLVTSCIVAVASYVPERMSHITRLTEQIRMPYTTVASEGIHHAVVMIDSWSGKGHVPGYRNASPSLDDDVIYCLWTDSASNRAVANYFADRQLYLLKYDSTTNYHVIVSPLDRKDLPSMAPGRN
jgi:4-amino-4-deoxy-L-arabinose transferase-like glycosyltransferase